MTAGFELEELGHYVEDEALLQIVMQMWDSFFSTVEPPYPAFEPIGAEGPVLCASVSISGARPGLVTVTVPQATASALAAVMLQEEALPEDEVHDALGEVANIVAGNVKALVPDAGSLGLPVLSTATPRLGNGAAEVGRMDAVWRDGWLSVIVWLS
ncbi:chemotaxis protein CheX [Kineococcus xinjiangensis]|uniref:Chemotaxis protein CheX n=1 Tax=Kineococcus xinjiangensis TaxID=512762 RepID=A0A2S6IFX0_9ACTN|nr:chemotaxis protein CheX [Kineococcus xinjiangensis]PPK93108.1 chemotaxis protein CheX [Kineococcus xinjiangensis]